jgi:hypothetical protein
LTILVPAYFYPAGPGFEDWKRLIEAAAPVPIVAIANPATGPGKSLNVDYAAIVLRAKKAGVKVIGYVNTEYAKRPRPEIEAEIDRWVRFYPEIQGIFLDAQASAPEHVEFYAALRDYARQKIKEAFLVANPGTVCAEEYLARSTADVTILFQDKGGFEAFNLPSWARNHHPRQFGAIPYAVETAEQMRDAVREAVAKGIGHLYVTDGAGANPWGQLPVYWKEEVDEAKQVNERKPR